MNVEKTHPQIGDTIRLLGDLLGQIIIEQSGQALFDLVENIRVLAKEWRLGDESAARKLKEITRELANELPKAATVVKAFSTYFRLVNLAEEHQRVNVLKRREDEAFQENRPMDESIRSAVETLKQEGLKATDIQNTLNQLYVSPVFTAHPTESRRKTIRQILKRISRLLQEYQSVGTYEFEKIELLEQIKSCIVLLWQTDETRNRRPTVMDEVRNTGLYFFEETLLDVVPSIYDELDKALRDTYPNDNFQIPSFLTYGSWIAGDRDGNPLVTADVTESALQAHLDLALERYEDDVYELYEWLSVSKNRAAFDPEFESQLQQQLNQLDSQAMKVMDRFNLEPYRQKLILIHRKLHATRLSNHQPARVANRDVYASVPEFLSDLRAIFDSLVANQGFALVRDGLKRLIRRVEVFGFHLATLDVRQHSARHRQAIAEVLDQFEIADNYASLEEPQKIELLTELIESKRPLVAGLDFTDDANEVFETVQLIARAQQNLGDESMSTYIISMTESVSNILEVLLLMKDAALMGKLDIVPLFETVDDLQNAPQTMAALFANTTYRKHLEMRGNRQMIMIGYSDSNKDGGYLRANWMLFTAQRNLATTCKQQGIQLTLFHGRGGSLGRGGGPANRAILAQPSESVAGRIRVTEQGEVVSSRYSSRGIARRHIQQMVHAAICSTGTRPNYPKLNQWNETMDELSQIAYRKYRELVDHSDFILYFQGATPIELVEHLNIGSRPSRRKPSLSIDDLRAIPWVFSWTQCRANISSWFGIGSALEQWCQGDLKKIKTLSEMFDQWQFFNTLLKNVHVGLGRADMGIAEWYAQLADDQAKPLFQTIKNEFELTTRQVLQVTEHQQLLDTEKWLQHSIRVRNPYVDPLNCIQVSLMERYRNHDALTDDDKSEIRQLLADSVNGIAAGLQNVG